MLRRPGRSRSTRPSSRLNPHHARGSCGRNSGKALGRLLGAISSPPRWDVISPVPSRMKASYAAGRSRRSGCGGHDLPPPGPRLAADIRPLRHPWPERTPPSGCDRHSSARGGVRAGLCAWYVPARFRFCPSDGSRLVSSDAITGSFSRGPLTAPSATHHAQPAAADLPSIATPMFRADVQSQDALIDFEVLDRDLMPSRRLLRIFRRIHADDSAIIVDETFEYILSILWRGC